MKISSNIVAREIHDTYFLINIKEDYSDEKCRLFEINEIGYFIWNQLIKMKNSDEIVEELKRGIIGDVDIEVLQNDVSEFIEELIKIGFILE